MALRFHFSSNVAEWKESIREKQRPVAEAGIAALRDVAAMSVQEGRQDIAAAGKFKGGWISGLQYRTSETTTEGGAPSINAKATIFHKIGLAGLFESGGIIHGRPILWIPIGDAPPIKKSRKKLTFATVGGTPLAFDAADKDRRRKPLYFGTAQAVIPDLFNVTEITEANFQKFGPLFYLHFKDET